MADPKKVDIVITDAVKVNGEHYAVGDVLTAVDYELAAELAGAGRARLAAPAEREPKRASKGA
jgi:hypothetical protein